MFKQLLVVILFGFILAGCGSTPKYNKLEFQESKVVIQRVPEELTVPCTPTVKRLIREEYLKLQPQERETVLKDYAISLLGTIKECDSRMEKIRNLPVAGETK